MSDFNLSSLEDLQRQFPPMTTPDFTVEHENQFYQFTLPPDTIFPKSFPRKSIVVSPSTRQRILRDPAIIPAPQPIDFALKVIAAADTDRFHLLRELLELATEKVFLNGQRQLAATPSH